MIRLVALLVITLAVSLTSLAEANVVLMPKDPVYQSYCGIQVLREALQDLHKAPSQTPEMFYALKVFADARRGFNTLSEIRNAARQMGLDARAVKVDLAGLRQLARRGSVVVNTTGNRHFCLIKKADDQVVSLYIPGVSYETPTMRWDEFAQYWNGAALVLGPAGLDLTGINTGYISLQEQRAIRGGVDCGNASGSGGSYSSTSGSGRVNQGNGTLPDAGGGVNPVNTNDPVNIANGNLFMNVDDIIVPGRGMPLALTRTYNAQVVSEVPGWTPDPGAGSWSVVDGMYSGQGDRVTTDDASYNNVTVELDMKTVTPGTNYAWETAWVHFRYTARTDDARKPQDSYYFLIKTDGNAELTKFQDGVQSFLTSVKTSLSPLKSNRIKIVAQAGNIKIYANSTLIINYTDAKPLLNAGRVGLESYFCHAVYDNVTITSGSTVTKYSFDKDSNDFIFGYGWTHTYSYRIDYISQLFLNLLYIKATPPHVTVYRPNGNRALFAYQTNGYKSFPINTYEKLTNDSSGYSLREKDGTHYRFNGKGPLQYVEDRNGNRITVTYTTVAGRSVPASVQDAAGRKLTFSYGSNGMVSSVTDPAGGMMQYFYDAAKHLVKVIDRGGAVTTYSYDPVTHNMLSYTTPDGKTYKYTYRYNDRILQQTDPLGKTLSFDFYWQTVHVINAKGEIYKYNFDSHMFIQSVTDPLNRMVRTLNDADGNILETYDADGIRTGVLVYDANGNPLKIHNAINGIRTMTFDQTLNLPLTSTDENGNKTVFTYDTKGNLIKKVDPAGGVITMSYTAYGQLAKVTDARGNSTSYSYDTYGNLVKVTDPLGGVTSSIYDGLGRVVKVTDPMNRSISYAYDANGHIVSETDLLLNKTTRTYSPGGLLTSETDPSGHVTQYQYDAVGNRVRITDAGKGEVTLAYDAKDHLHLGRSLLTSVVDARKGTTTYQYDALGRLIKAVDATGKAYTYEYDYGQGNLIRRVDPDGIITDYSYDLLHRLTKTESRAGASAPLKWERYFSYNAIGQVIRTGNYVDTGITGSDIVYTYDAAGRKTSETISMPGQDTVTMRWGYDAQGNRLSYEIVGLGKTTYVYDKLNRLTSLTPSNGKVTVFGYNAGSDRTSLILGNQSKAVYSYDGAGRMSGMFYQKSSGTTLGGYSYTFDASGLRKTIAETGAGTLTFAYDVLDQLKSVVYPAGYGFSNTVWQYDVMGNRTQMTAGTSVTAYTTNLLNQYTKTGTTGLSYNARGDVTFDGSISYGYDDENRVVSAARSGSTLGYTYDSWGRRITRSLNGSKVWYYYDGDNVVMERDAGKNVLARYDYGPGTDEVLCLYKGSSTYYYHADGQGSTGIVTDASQNVVERYRYDVFGLVQIRNGAGSVIAASAVGNRYLYTGREWEPEIRTYHYRARMYHPVLGRFLQRDPIGFGDDFNLYRYVKNSPVNFVDPWGLEALAQDRNGNAYVPIWEDPIVWVITSVMGGPVKTILDLMRYDTYWKYMSEGSNPTGPYLTGKNSFQPPYGRDYIEARDKLQLPRYPSDVIQVKVPKSEPVAGPREVQGNPRLGSGGGDEWYRGKEFPPNKISQ